MAYKTKNRNYQACSNLKIINNKPIQLVREIRYFSVNTLNLNKSKEPIQYNRIRSEIDSVSFQFLCTQSRNLYRIKTMSRPLSLWGNDGLTTACI